MENKLEEDDKSELILDENNEKICNTNELNIKNKAWCEENVVDSGKIDMENEKNIENDIATTVGNENLDEIIFNHKEIDNTNVNSDIVISTDELDGKSITVCQKNDDSQGNSNENQLSDVSPLKSIAKPERSLVADYRSASESETDDNTESFDSESDSSYESSDSEDKSESDSDSEPNIMKKKKPKKDQRQTDLSYADLPPIEDLKISVPEGECEEIGTVTSIVDALVVVECYKGTAPLDIDSILFLDKGKKSLGKIFDVIGPVSEPVYTVRFTNVDQIKRNGIEKAMKVFCAPKTNYSTYVFLPDLLKMKGSDASWKDNVEAPPECQDFSDDEEEQKYKSVVRNVRNENNRRRNPDGPPQDYQKKVKTWKNHNNPRPPGKYINPSRFQNPQQFQRPVNNFATSSSWSYQPQMTSSLQSSPSFTPFNNNPFARSATPVYSNNPPFSSYRFPNVPPFPPGNFVFNPTPPPPPSPATSSVQTQGNSYPTRMTGPPPFSSFVAAPPGNRMPMAPFPNPFGQGFAQQPNFYSPHMQMNNLQNAQRDPTPMSRTFGLNVQGPPPPPPPPSV